MSLYKRLGDNWIWGLKYRPSTVKELILPVKIKKQFNSFIKDNKIPNILLSGPPGTGKTSVAVVLTESMDLEYLYINGSEQTSIDVVRTKVKQFVTTKTWDNKRKVVIWDEFERLSPQGQDAAKVFLEEFSKTCSFICISNHKNKIIEPLQSRFQSIDFIFSSTESNKLKKEFFVKCKEILDQEKVQYKDNVLAHVIHKMFPDMRKTLNELQKFAQQDVLSDMETIKGISADTEEYYKILGTKDFAKAKKYVAELGADPQTFYSQLYDTFVKYIDGKSIPEFVVLLNKYSYEAAFVADPRINILAFSAEVLLNIGMNDEG